MLFAGPPVFDVSAFANQLGVDRNDVVRGLSGTVPLICGDAGASANLVNGLRTLVTTMHGLEPYIFEDRLSECHVYDDGIRFDVNAEPGSYQCGRSEDTPQKSKSRFDRDWCLFTLKSAIPRNLNYYMVTESEPAFGRFGIDADSLAWELSTTAIFYGDLESASIAVGTSRCFSMDSFQLAHWPPATWQLPPEFLSGAADNAHEHLTWCAGVQGNSGGAVTRAITSDTLLGHRRLAGLIVGGMGVLEQPAVTSKKRHRYNRPALAFTPGAGRLADAIIALSLPGLIEHRLEELGCAPARVDGTWDRRSRKALQAFDHQVGIPIRRSTFTHDLANAAGQPGCKLRLIVRSAWSKNGVGWNTGL
ncbi:MAG: hypothetical protein AAFX39_04975 [Pseudomonadota bacterium]